MFRRLLAIYRRYATSGMQFALPGCHLTDETGAMIGHVDSVEVGNGMMRVTGWAAGDRVTLQMATQAVSATPTILRTDVFVATGLGPETGFDLVLPCNYEALLHNVPGIRVERAKGPELPARPILSRALPRRERARLTAGFAVRLCAALPLAVHWRRRHDPAIRARFKAALQMRPATTGLRLLDDELLLQESQDNISGPSDALVVVPVYNGFDLLEPALSRLLRHTPPEAHLLLIDDCSPDERVAPFLGRLAQQTEAATPGRLTHLRNPSNLGFIGSVNRAFEVARRDHPGRPVVLVNSDAFVPEGWLPRLLAPLADAEVASVTPMSNDAEIFTAPVICKPLAIAPGAVDRVDAVARPLAAGPVVAPTGVGFCMAIAPAWLDEVPRFDPAFGRGYGEEVDWCQKVRAAGGHHVALPSLFVEHRGGASFGSDAKLMLVAKNNAIVAGRYPGYDSEVQDFIRGDPLLTSRMLLGLAVIDASSDAPVPIYLAHDLGGGAETYLAERIAADLESQRSSVVIRVGGWRRWQIELVTPEGTTIGQTDSTAALMRLLAPLSRRHIVYSCGVGDRDPMELPELLAGLKAGPGDRLEILFHDFFPLSPSYTLLDRDGVYRGVPTIDSTDPAHQTRRVDGREVSLLDWRQAWHGLARRADELRVFSSDSGDHVATAWPDLAGRIRVVPHLPARLPTRLERPDGPPVIGVLGNIGPQKGIGIVRDLALAIADRGKDATPVGLVVVGNTDPTHPLPKWVTVTGTYSAATFSDIVRRHRITHWLIPSIWPETFSFTTHEALATGLPVLAFDLGAQGAAVAAAPNGYVLPRPIGDDDAARIILASVHDSSAQATNGA